MKKSLLFFLISWLIAVTPALSQKTFYGAAENQLPAVETQQEPGKFMVKIAEERDDQFATTIYTFGDITVFAYFNQTDVNIYDQGGTLLTTQSLNADEYFNYFASAGIYRIVSNKTFTVLVGDAINAYVNGYFAVDESGRGVSTKLNTWMMEAYGAGSDFIVFAYNDNTNFTVRNLESNAYIAGSSLNEGEHFSFAQFGAIPETTPLQVTSDKPISALSYSDQDYYVPSSNGTFAGNLFYGYSAYVGSWTNSITITSYENNNQVVITNSETGTNIGTVILNEGQVATFQITSPTFWKVESEHTVTVANIPYGYYSGSYYYMTRAIDEGGSGAGTLFYMPVIGSRVDVFSFSASNNVTITKLGLYDAYPYASPEIVWQGTLNEGEGYNFTSLTGSFVYKVVSDEPVSVLQSNGGAGADFMPLSYALDLPDLSISTTDISFSVPDSVYNPGDQIQVSFMVHNYGSITASDVQCKVYAFDPDATDNPKAIYTTSLASIAPYGEASFTMNYTIPQYPEYRSLYVKVDPETLIVESNYSNNNSERTLRPNTDLEAPLAISVTAPMYLAYDGNVLDPNPFNVHFDIFNIGGAVANNVTAQLTCMNGLTSSTSNINIGNIPVNGTYPVDVEITADPLQLGYGFYSLTLYINGEEEKTVNRMVMIGDISGINEVEVLKGLTIHPNPASDVTEIVYNLDEKALLNIELYDVTGSKIKTVLNEYQNRGVQSVKMDVSNLDPGIYLLNLKAGDQSVVKKVMVAK